MTDSGSVLCFAVILAGGSGERFWPISRKDRPKQFVTLPGQSASLLQQSVDRLNGLFPERSVFVVTSESLQSAIRGALPDFPMENTWAEPAKRNTLGALLWAAAKLHALHGPEAVMCVLTADHLIEPTPTFHAEVRQAITAAVDTGDIVTIGIRPTRPETAFGYIESDPLDDSLAARRVVRFHEKPNVDMAQTYVAQDSFYWNSGMFFWALGTLDRELASVSPGISATYRQLCTAMIEGDDAKAARSFLDLPDISIDYALMERTERARVVPASFQWDDVGSWDALQRFLPSDERGNAVFGDVVLSHTADCMVYNQSKGTTLALAGVYDLLVVVTDDAVLVCNQQNAQEVRSIVRQLRDRNVDKI